MILPAHHARILRALRDAPPERNYLDRSRFSSGDDFVMVYNFQGTITPSTVVELRTAGLIHLVEQREGWESYQITPAGAEALAQWEAGR